MKKIFVFNLILLILLFSIASCQGGNKIVQQEYYQTKENYIECRGQITFINYDDRCVYLGIEILNNDGLFSDDCFKIQGQNFLVVKDNGFIDEIDIGDEVVFISAPRYFGDGYVYPIVSIKKESKIYLDFDIGYNNFIIE